MGTNFYIRGDSIRMQEHPMFKGGTIHVGKRSAAGAYCYLCEKHLYSDREEIHSGLSKPLKECPGCQLPFADTWGCCSWLWAITPSDLVSLLKSLSKKCPHCHESLLGESRVIEDEYGTVYSFNDFVTKELASVRWFRHDSIGKYFS